MDCTRFGNKLNYYRERNDMTEKDLARKLGVTVRMVEKWENSEAVPNDRIIQKLSDMFGVDFWNYLDLDEKHGGMHDPDDEPDRSPFEIMRENMAAKKKRTGRTSSNLGMRKILSVILAVLAAVFFIIDDFIFYDLLNKPELEVISLPVTIVLLVLSSVIGGKKK